MFHNIIQIHSNVMWDSQCSIKYPWIFSTFSLNIGNFCGILSVPQNIVMD